jgi:hypothetical protein
MVKARFVSGSHGIVFFCLDSGDRTLAERFMMKPGSGRRAAAGAAERDRQRANGGKRLLSRSFISRDPLSRDRALTLLCKAFGERERPYFANNVYLSQRQKKILAGREQAHNKEAMTSTQRKKENSAPREVKGEIEREGEKRQRKTETNRQTDRDNSSVKHGK